MLITSVEFMFYNNNIHTGIIYSYLFFQTNRGNLVSKKDISVFLPDNYTRGYEAKLSCFICTYICLLIVSIFWYQKNMRKKVRAAIGSKVNEFYMTDVLTMI